MKNHNCRLILILLSLILPSIFSQSQNPGASEGTLNQQLDQLKNTYYKQMYHKPINISVGQQLNIVLPSFDSSFNENVFSFKYLSDEEYAKTINKLEMESQNQGDDFQSQSQKRDQKQNQDKSEIGTKVLESQLPIKCSFQAANARVYETISKINDESGTTQINFQNKLYVHVSSRQLVYIMNVQTMVLTVNYYNDLNIKFLASFQFPINKKDDNNKNQIGYGPSHPSISMSLNSKQTELYIFGSVGIWVIQTKTFLTNIKSLQNISGFSPVETGGLDKVVRGTGPYFVGLKKMNNVFIIPQISSNQRAKFTEVNKYGEQHIFPQDIAVHSSYLFILDVYKGIYIYKILTDYRTKQLFKISLSNYGGNYRIHVSQLNTLFVMFNDFDGSKVVEINLDIQNKQAKLVRYFKNDDFISQLKTYSVLTSSTGFYLNEISEKEQFDKMDIKHIRNSAQSLLFMISNFQQMQIFPFNIDPRTINSIYNGVKIHYPKVKDIYHILQDRYLIITQDSLDYVKIQILKPQVNCLIGQKYNQDYKISPQNLLITVKSNISTCQYRNKLFRHKYNYNQNCQLTTQYLIHLADPQQSNLTKIITYAIVLLVVASFILGLFCLVQWRNQKLIILSRLKDQIIRFRNRHRRMQPFVEENNGGIGVKKEVEMEVPKDIQFIPNQEQQNQ